MKKYRSITVNTTVYEKMQLSSSKVSFQLEKYLEEKKKLRKFASKITKVPETVRVYPTNIREDKS